MKTLREANIKRGTRVLVRCDFNCSIDEKGNILEDFRIRSTLPTIKYLLGKGAKIILMSHLDDPKGKVVESLRLTPIADTLFSSLNLSILKAPDCIGKNIQEMVKELEEGEILLLENLRFHQEEEENSEDFAKELSLLGEIYVNDAFGVCHRAHASIVGVPKFLPSFAGFLLESEVKNLSKILEKPKRPLVAIFGGVKLKTKLPAVQRFLQVADFVLVGGKIAKEIDFSHPRLYKATDFNQGFDIGDKTIERFKDLILKAKTIIWNGPMGYFEKKEFEKGTKEIAKAISESEDFKVAGGGETVLAILKYGLGKSFSFLSTGGGAMLDFLAGKKLPGIEILK